MPQNGHRQINYKGGKEQDRSTNFNGPYSGFWFEQTQLFKLRQLGKCPPWLDILCHDKEWLLTVFSCDNSIVAVYTDTEMFPNEIIDVWDLLFKNPGEEVGGDYRQTRRATHWRSWHVEGGWWVHLLNFLLFKCLKCSTQRTVSLFFKSLLFCVGRLTSKLAEK